MEKIVVWKEFRDFRATTEDNYNARIMDMNKVWEFNHTENYETFDDVVDTIEKRYIRYDELLLQSEASFIRRKLNT